MTPEFLKALLAALIAIAASTSGQLQSVQQAITLIEGVIAPAAVPVTVTTFAELQRAIDIMPGAEIRLQPGVTYSGHLVLRKKTCSPETVITTDGPLPGAGVQVTPAAAGTLGILASPDFDAAVKTEFAACGYRFVGVQIAPLNGGYCSFCIGTNTEKSLADYATQIVADRVLILGIDAWQQRNGIRAIGADITVINSWIDNIKFVGEDAQAIRANGPGPFRFENNHLESSGEPLMVGGEDPSVANVVPSDGLIARNTLTRRLSWRGGPYSIKNSFELKNARRFVVSYNVIENSWQASQNGYAALLTPRNQSGTCPWCIVEDIQFEYNVVRHAAGGINVLGTDDEHVSMLANQITIQHNTIYDIGSAWGSGGYAFMLGAGVADLTIDHNTVDQTNSRGLILAYGAPMPNFRFTNNVARQDAYGVLGSGKGTGLPAINYYFPNAVFSLNAIAGAPSKEYPAGNLFPTAIAFLAHFVNPAAGDYHLKPSTDWAGAGTDGADLGASIPSLQVP